MVPLLWVGLGVGSAAAVAIGHVAARRSRASRSRVLVLDTALPDAAKQQVIQAVCTERDPTTLGRLADALAAQGYACAPYELRLRAWELAQGPRSAKPARPASCAAPAPPSAAAPPPGAAAPSPCADLDPTLDPATCAAVANALALDVAPSDLEGFAATLQATHPRAALALYAKAQALRGGAAPAAPPPPAPPPGPTAAAAGTPSPCADLDPGMDRADCDALAALLAPGVDPTALAAGLSALLARLPVDRFPRAHALLGARLAIAQLGVAEPSPAAQAGAAGPPLIVDQAPPTAVPFLQGELNPPTIDGAIRAASDLTQQIGEAPAPSAAYATPRPVGHWYVDIRPTDKVWPASLAKMGSRSQSGALGQLFAMNPHLHVGGQPVIETFRPGDRVNVPGPWREELIRKGFRVVRD